jgi:hypothetical protein
MTPKLSDEQREALLGHGGAPVDVVDGKTGQTYVLMSTDDYRRVRALLGTEELDVRETYPLQERVAREQGWNDPALDEYNDDCRHRETQ